MRIRLNFILGLFCFFVLLHVTAQSKKFHFVEQKMGSPLNLVFVENDSIKANMLAKHCFLLVDSLVAVFSDYDSSSELSKLNKRSGTGPIPVSPALMDILLLSKKAFEKSKHRFDISIGPLSTLWRKSRKSKQFPTEIAVRNAKKIVGFEHINIDSTAHTISLDIKGMQLDLGGIAKGYIAEKVIHYLSLQGVNAALVDAGGDICVSDAPLNSKGWLIGINEPEQTEKLLPEKIQLSNKSVATSGDIYQYILHNGKKYAHIINPITGYGVSFQRNVTIIANNAANADWLATACSILPILEAMSLVEKEGAAALITFIENHQIKAFKSKHFELFLKKE